MLRLPRFLLAFAALVLATGGLYHAASFNRSFATVAASNLPTLYLKIFKAFWLMDSATLLFAATIFVMNAIRPSAAMKPFIFLVAFLPASTAALLYFFVGSYFAAHILMVAATSAFVAGMLFRSPNRSAVDVLN